MATSEVNSLELAIRIGYLDSWNQNVSDLMVYNDKVTYIWRILRDMVLSQVCRVI